MAPIQFGWEARPLKPLQSHIWTASQLTDPQAQSCRGPSWTRSSTKANLSTRRTMWEEWLSSFNLMLIWSMTWWQKCRCLKKPQASTVRAIRWPCPSCPITPGKWWRDTWRFTWSISDSMEFMWLLHPLLSISMRKECTIRTWAVTISIAFLKDMLWLLNPQKVPPISLPSSRVSQSNRPLRGTNIVK